MRTITLCLTKLIAPTQLHPEDTELLAKIDDALQKMRNSGEYEAISKKYFAR